MNIKSLNDIRAPRVGLVDLFVPVIIRAYPLSNLGEYTVQKQEDMRIDLVMSSIYGEDCDLENVDIICFINNIDNPLNIFVGQKLYYPSPNEFDSYRITTDSKKSSSKIKNRLAIPNKTNRKDNNRSKYIDSGYSLPPVVLNTPKAPVRLEDKSILVGGVSKN